MYRRITIKNFRSIADAKLTLSPFTVVVGPNGSGKSNLVDALVFLRDVAYDAETAVTSRGGVSGVVRWSPTKPFDMRLTLRVSPASSSAESEFFEHDFTVSGSRGGDWKFKKERIEHRRSGHTTLVERTGTSIKLSGDEGGAFELQDKASAMVWARQVLKLPPPLRSALFGVRRYRLNPDAMRQPQLVSDNSRLVESGANIATAVQRLRKDDRMDEILLPMQRIVPGLEGIEPVVAGRHLLLQFNQQQGNGSATFSASELSDGALRALGIIVAARQMGRSELLIIEEPEANVHIGAARLLFDVLHEVSRRSSVLITTHSPELLDAADAGDIVVCAYDGGVTRIGPLAEEQRALVRQGLFRVAELMRVEPLRIQGEIPPLASA